MFKRIPGTKDILPSDVSAWQDIEAKSRHIFWLKNYSEIRPPLLEDLALFNRSLGEFAEVVQKQMFVIPHGQDSYALRPEGTASVVRAYIENNLDKISGFVKLYYIGPMFRLERPQKGRLRQFHHIGAEVIGSGDPKIDSEVISLCDMLLKEYRIQGYAIKLNSLGCAKDKKDLTVFLQKELSDKLENLCVECRQRFSQNILRILDCKNEQCRQVIKKIELNDQHLCPECKEHFQTVRQNLDAVGVSYKITPHLVRGLDYYTRTVFEITHPLLGAQDAVGAGGRYDNLVEELGGAPSPAIGFAFGVERLLLVADSTECLATTKSLVYVIPLGQEAQKLSFELSIKLPKASIPTDTTYSSVSLKSAMRKANDLGARFAVIIGDDELKKNAVTLKDMLSGAQEEVQREKLEARLKELIKE